MIKFPSMKDLPHGKCKRVLMISFILTAVGIITMLITAMIMSKNMISLLGSAFASTKVLVLIIGLYILGTLCHNNFNRTVKYWLIIKGVLLAIAVGTQLITITSPVKKTEGFCGACAAALIVL